MNTTKNQCRTPNTHSPHPTTPPAPSVNPFPKIHAINTTAPVMKINRQWDKSPYKILSSIGPGDTTDNGISFPTVD